MIRFALIGLAIASTAGASQLFVNGGFETGTTSGWTVTNSGPGTFTVTSASVTPLTGNPTVGPAGGTYYAVSDDFGPGMYALTQTFLVPVGTTSAVLSFDFFTNDVFGTGGSPQFGEVDLLAAGADPITGTPLTVFISADSFDSDPGAPNAYVHFSADIIGALTPGLSYQIRAFDSDSTGPFDTGVDDFSLLATGGSVPEPGTFLPVALVAGILLYTKRAYRSRKAAVSSRS
jgi:hypothetical protein